MRHRQFINSAVSEDNVGKIELWGDVYETQPIDWWTGKPVEGEFITVQKFKDAMESVKNCSRIELHLNSYGGDATVGILIHNLLKASGKKITCIIDAIAASAAFTIASACDEVLVYPGSIMMCHEVASLVWGYYQNDELQEIINGNAAYNSSAATMYSKKSGLSKQQCLNLMNKTTWMDAEQAVKYGFADGIISVDETKEPPVELVNKTTMKVNGQEYDIKDLHVPDEFIQHIQNKGKTGGMEEMSNENLKDRLFNAVASIFKNDADIEDTQGAEEQEGQPVEEQDQAPEQTPTEEPEQAPVEPAEDVAAQVENAIKEERARIQEIQSISVGIDEELVKEAMFGETACSAAELALRAQKKDIETQQKALEKMNSDSEESKVNEVSGEPGQIADGARKEADEREAAIDAMVAKIKQGGK